MRVNGDYDDYEMTLEEIARLEEVSMQRIQQIISGVIKKLRGMGVLEYYIN